MTIEKPVYWASVEYRHLPGSVSYGRYKGGVVYIFVKAKDVLDCVAKIEVEFNSLSLEIDTIEFVSLYDDIPWENGNDQKKYDGLAQKALTSDAFVCDDFMAYIEE